MNSLPKPKTGPHDVFVVCEPLHITPENIQGAPALVVEVLWSGMPPCCVT